MIARAGYEKKARDIVVLDLGKVNDFTDFFVICTAEAKTQMRAIGKYVEEQMRANNNALLHMDGYQGTSWVVLDFGDVVVHIMSHEAREYYDLEKLWGDAKVIDWKKRSGAILSSSSMQRANSPKKTRKGVQNG